MEIGNNEKDRNIVALEEAVKKATGLKFDIIVASDAPTGRKYYFTIREDIEIPSSVYHEAGQKLFAHLLSRARDAIAERIKSGEMWTTREAAHKKEVEAFEAEIAKRDKDIEHLMKFKHHFDLECLKLRGPESTTSSKIKLNS